MTEETVNLEEVELVYYYPPGNPGGFNDLEKLMLDGDIIWEKQKNLASMTLRGNNPHYHELSSSTPYFDAGADVIDEDGSVGINLMRAYLDQEGTTIAGPTAFSTTGTLYLKLLAFRARPGEIPGNPNDAIKDSDGNQLFVWRTLIITPQPIQNAPPVITLTGGDVNHVQNQNWVDPGYSATDDQDGNITNSVQISYGKPPGIPPSNSFDTSVLGTWIVYYTVTDSAGLQASKTRNVTVIPAPIINTPPTLTLIGENSITVSQNSVFVEPGYTASDAEDGNITNKVQTTIRQTYPSLPPPSDIKSAIVTTTRPVEFEITYSVTDSNGATAQKTRDVQIGPPMVTTPTISIQFITYNSDTNKFKLAVSLSRVLVNESWQVKHETSSNWIPQTSKLGGEFEYLNFFPPHFDYRTGSHTMYVRIIDSTGVVLDTDEKTFTHATVSGCTNPTASNYNPNATIDNGSCIFAPVHGCTDQTATNYNPAATFNNGSCIYPSNLIEGTKFATISYTSGAGGIGFAKKYAIGAYTYRTGEFEILIDGYITTGTSSGTNSSMAGNCSGNCQGWTDITIGGGVSQANSVRCSAYTAGIGEGLSLTDGHTLGTSCNNWGYGNNYEYYKELAKTLPRSSQNDAVVLKVNSTTIQVCYRESNADKITDAWGNGSTSNFTSTCTVAKTFQTNSTNIETAKTWCRQNNYTIIAIEPSDTGYHKGTLQYGWSYGTTGGSGGYGTLPTPLYYHYGVLADEILEATRR